MDDVVIVAALRTAIGKFGGTLAKTPASDLGAHIIAALVKQTGISGDQISEVVLGQVLTAATGQNPARQAAMKAGLPDMVPAMTINKVCGSGLKATHLAAQAIKAGDAQVVIAGGQENMSIAPHSLSGVRDGIRMGDGKLVDTMIIDGLWDAYNHYHMGVTAENVAKKWGVTREQQDAFAAASQQKAEAAQKGGRFNDEIVPFTISTRKGDIVFDADEFPRHGTTAESLGGLRPAFEKDGTVTAGNASGLNDGAAAVLMMSAKKADQLGLQPLARIKAYSSAGVDPSIMGIGPIPASKLCLKKAGWDATDQRNGLGYGECQRERRRNRPWPPDRCVRLPHSGHAVARNGQARREKRTCFTMHWRRYGRCTRGRALTTETLKAGALSTNNAPTANKSACFTKAVAYRT